MPLNSPFGLELSFTVTAEIWRGFYMLTLNVSHQVSFLIDVFVANTTTPVLCPRRGVYLTDTLLLDVGRYSIVLNKN
jgi:hypothetical protein